MLIWCLQCLARFIPVGGLTGLMLLTGSPTLAEVTDFSSLDRMLGPQSAPAMEELFGLSLRHQPLPAQTYLHDGHRYTQQGNYHQALLTYLSAFVLEPQNPDVLAAVGLALWHLEQPQQALSYLQQAHQLAPQRDDIWLWLSALQLQTTPLAFRSVPSAAPWLGHESANLLLSLADYARTQSHLDMAMTLYRQLAAQYPDDPRLQSRLGDGYLAQNNTLMAVVAYRHWTRLAPAEPTAYYQLAQALALRQRRPEAIVTFQQALDLFQEQEDFRGAAMVNAALQELHSD